ncbi:hypothetical protein [Dokdonia sp. Dokd-P16]|uniref:hypothetical protein n=1 Tax=Dokdonia sp. Dokd-P16 TaxID=2173169 RepID=UPI003977CF73
MPDGSELPDGTYDVDASVEDAVGNTASDTTTDELTIDSASQRRQRLLLKLRMTPRH